MSNKINKKKKVTQNMTQIEKWVESESFQLRSTSEVTSSKKMLRKVEWSTLTTLAQPEHPLAPSQNFFGNTLGPKLTPDISHVTVP